MPTAAPGRVPFHDLLQQFGLAAQLGLIVDGDLDLSLRAFRDQITEIVIDLLVGRSGIVLGTDFDDQGLVGAAGIPGGYGSPGVLSAA